jgi:enamine deaminase RidA (YjgF/YER057c/UK114 family)
MEFEIIQPEGWAPPKGYCNGMLVRNPGALLFVAGQIAWDADQALVGQDDFVAQFAQALRNVVSVIETAGGRASHLARVTIYVTDKAKYMACVKEVGAAWRELVGGHYPPMALVEVADLLEPGALVEIEATAALP